MILNSNQEEEGSEIVQTSPGSYQLPANVHLLTLAIIPETEQVRILNLITISIPFLTRIEWNSWYLTSTFVYYKDFFFRFCVLLKISDLYI